MGRASIITAGPEYMLVKPPFESEEKVRLMSFGGLPNQPRVESVGEGDARQNVVYYDSAKHYGREQAPNALRHALLVVRQVPVLVNVVDSMEPLPDLAEVI